ncbi:MAG: hypothetical protein SGPRY_007742 [Prymnesium sp.]
MAMDAALREELFLATISATVMRLPQGWDLSTPSIDKFLRRVPALVLSVPRFVFSAQVADAHTMGGAQVWKPQVMRFLYDRRSLDSQYTLMFLLACRAGSRNMYVDGKLPALYYSRVRMHDDADREKLQHLAEMHLHLRTQYGQPNVEVE